MDSRFHLKAEFEIYGRVFVWKSSLNWTAEPGECDPRIAEWFAQCYDSARAKHEQWRAEFTAAAEAEIVERSERAELKRLRDKYPDA